MSEAMIIALMGFAVKFGIPAAQAFLSNINKPSVSLDDAIKALESAAEKSAEDYLREARARAGIPEPVPPV